MRYKIQLNKDQQSAVDAAYHWFFHESSQVFEIDGDAGTGKSVTIFEILRKLGLREYEYMAMAYTGQAAVVMRSKGFRNAKSIHSSLYEVVEVAADDNFNSKFFGRPIKVKKFRKRKFLDRQIKLLFIDEAYMVPKRIVNDILSFGVKVIVCGDSKQLPPINDDPGFLTGPGVHHLTELMRQSAHSPIVYLARRAAEGKFIHTGTYGNDVLVINDDDLIPQMLGVSECICCGTNMTRETLNAWVRTVAGYDNSRFPFFGERVICRDNNWSIELDGIALANGLCGYVANKIDVTRLDTKRFFIDFKPDLLNNIFTDLAVDMRYFLGNYEEKHEMKMLNNKKMSFGEYFEYAYALTTHLCQGGEYQQGIYVEEFLNRQTTNQLNYTGITRFKKKLIYVKKATRYISIPESNI